MKEIHSSMAQYLELVEQTVRPHLSNPNFYFDIKGAPDVKMKSIVGYPNQGNYIEMPLLHFLYGKHYKSATPSDILVVRNIRTSKTYTLTDQ
jgi:hypothetical protein